MNLRQLNRTSNWNPGELSEAAAHPSNVSTVRFQVESRIVANMGEPLRDDSDDEALEDVDGDELAAPTATTTGLVPGPEQHIDEVHRAAKRR